MYKKYFDENELLNEFVSFIESLNVEKFDTLLNNIPKNITDREPIGFTEYNEVRVSDFKQN